MPELHPLAVLVIALAAIFALGVGFAFQVVVSRWVWGNAPRAKLAPRQDAIDDDETQRR
jgi:hypothetical protein